MVDDEPDTCEVISHFLGRRGYAVITANSAEEALSKLSTEKPELILLDILMPGMDGIECLRKIREINKEVPIIMVTCIIDIDTANQAIELGATDYLTKPLGYNALETAISTYLFLKSPSAR
jgi:two-component system NtrC family response regulator